MLEVKNELSDQSDMSTESRVNAELKELKLPRIQQFLSYQRPNKNRSTTKLPFLKNESCSQYSQRDINKKLEEDEDFIVSVDKKLRMIRQEQNIVELQESDDSGEDNFQRKINENKEIIKQLRIKNELSKKQNEEVNTIEKGNGRSKAIQMLSHRHMKAIFKKNQFKQKSLESKFSEKKRAIFNNFGRKQSWKEKINTPLKEQIGINNKEVDRIPRQVKSKDGLIPEGKVLPTSSHKKHSLFGQRKLTKQFSHKILTPVEKNEQLFDAIHNYLQNPKRSEQVLNPIKLSRNKEELSQKLRQYQQKLIQVAGNNSCVQKGQKENIKLAEEQSNKATDNNIHMVTNSHWRKISLNSSGLLSQQNSSFDNQIDRINAYLQRNDKSLGKYVQNQKMLVDIQLAVRNKDRVCTTKDIANNLS